MPSYIITVDGNEYEVDSPVALTDAQAYQAAVQGASKENTIEQPAVVPEKPEDVGQPLTWPQAGAQAVGNLPESTGRLFQGIYSAVSSPIQTAKAVRGLGRGLVQAALPDSFVDFMGRDEEGDRIAKAVGGHYLSRYGGQEQFKQALADDPAGIIADVSTLLMGGGSVAAKIPQLAGVGQKISSVGRAIEPVSAVLGAVGKGAKGAGAVTANILGATTGAGPEAIKTAVKAGFAGGPQGKAFLQNLRGSVEGIDVVSQARDAIAKIRQAASDVYRRNMVGVTKDKTVLDFDDIDAALLDSKKYGMFRGVVKNKAVMDALGQVRNKIDKWKSLDPAQFHTPEGLDQLKQSIGEVLQGVDPTNRTVYSAVKKSYDAIKASVSKQAPDYSRVMKDYSEASDLIFEMERALSLGKKASADTTLRKLTSLMRNNASTNYGERLRLGQQLDEVSGGTLMPALAGQSLGSGLPRSLQIATAAPTTIGLGVAGNPLMAAGYAGASSPRLVGEIASKAGAAARLPAAAASKIAPYATPEAYNALYQTGLLNSYK